LALLATSRDVGVMSAMRVGFETHADRAMRRTRQHNGCGVEERRVRSSAGSAGSPMLSIADTERTQIYRPKSDGHKPLELLNYLA
jgi:hypothetical protein